MKERTRPQLLINPWIRGEQVTYGCSICGQVFLPPEDRNPKEAMAELWAAFQAHVRETHAGETND